MLRYEFIMIVMTTINFVLAGIFISYYYACHSLNYWLKVLLILHLTITSMLVLIIVMFELSFIIINYYLTSEAVWRIKKTLLEFLFNSYTNKFNLLSNIIDILYSKSLGGGTSEACQLADELEVFRTGDKYTILKKKFALLDRLPVVISRPVLCWIKLKLGIKTFSLERDIRTSIVQIVDPVLELFHFMAIFIVIRSVFRGKDSWNSILEFKKCLFIYACLWILLVICTFL